MSSDSVQLCLSRKTGEMLQRLRANRPLVHCITNEVVQEITADVLLAAGASPAMVVGEGEAEYFAGIASALSVNVVRSTYRNHEESNSRRSCRR